MSLRSRLSHAVVHLDTFLAKEHTDHSVSGLFVLAKYSAFSTMRAATLAASPFDVKSSGANMWSSMQGVATVLREPDLYQLVPDIALHTALHGLSLSTPML